jgi:hypothetical protein
MLLLVAIALKAPMRLLKSCTGLLELQPNTCLSNRSMRTAYCMCSRSDCAQAGALAAAGTSRLGNASEEQLHVHTNSNQAQTTCHGCPVRSSSTCAITARVQVTSKLSDIVMKRLHHCTPNATHSRNQLPLPGFPAKYCAIFGCQLCRKVPAAPC